MGKEKKKKKKEEEIMPSLVATMFAHARTTCVRRHSSSTKMKKDGGVGRGTHNCIGNFGTNTYKVSVRRKRRKNLYRPTDIPTKLVL